MTILLFCFFAFVLSQVYERPLPSAIEYFITPNELSLITPISINYSFPISTSILEAEYLLHGTNEFQSCQFTLTGHFELLLPDMELAQTLTNYSGIILVCPKTQYMLVSVEVMEVLEAINANKINETRLLRTSKEQKEYPYTAAEIFGITLRGDLLGYAGEFLRNHWGPLHPFQSYSAPDTGIYSLNTGEQLPADRDINSLPSFGQVRISATGDWGAGTKESAYCANAMVHGFDPHYTIHIGDVYYVGTSDEHKSNCLGIPPPNVIHGVTWPHGSLGSFGLNGNHEMYSRGYGYFDDFLPTLGIRDQKTQKLTGQKASYWALENKYWRIIGLDTGYNTYSKIFENDDNSQPQDVIDWLINTVHITNLSDTRGIIFMSHHQYYSAWYDVSLATPEQLAQLVPDGRQILWLWGHEHRFSLYDIRNSGGLPLNVYGRDIGTGGFPPQIVKPPEDPQQNKLMAYDERIYTYVTANHGPVKAPTGFNGWARLTFNNDALKIDYMSLALDDNGELSDTKHTILVSEKWQIDLTKGNILLQGLEFVDPNITVVPY